MIERRIIENEERLRQAMLNSDVNTLDELIAPELLFTSHLGKLWTKEQDLSAHRSGMIKIEKITPSERHIQVVGDIAIVSVRIYISGTYEGHRSEGDLRFTRVWAMSTSGKWQVVAGHASGVV
jgi:ketosteroid isomerase-like protein